jgi:uncharacterized membrane protein YedE/YeeE
MAGAMKPAASAFGAGALFGVGLCVSGMTDPRNIVGFLDVTGAFNPRLAGVMIGAIAVHTTLLRLVRRWRGQPVPAAPRPFARQEIGGRVLLGAAIFGVGWGLSGYCPGPAIVSLGSGAARALVFVGAMVVGALLAEGLLRPKVEATSPRT